MRGLEDPVGAGTLPAEDLKDLEEVLVCPRVILAFQPVRIARYMHGGLGRLAHEVQIEEQDVLFRLVVIHRMKRHELGGKIGKHPLGEPCVPLASVRLARLRAGCRYRVERLRRRDALNLGMRTEQALQQGGAAALQSSDQHDLAKRKVMNLRMRREEILDPQPMNQRAGKPRFLNEPAGCGQPGFVVDRPNEHFQSSEMSVVPEVCKPGLALRLVYECVDSQRTRQPEVSADLPDPVEDPDRDGPIRILIVRGSHRALFSHGSDLPLG